MRIKISSDSTCDLSPELVKANDIEIIPLCVTKAGEVFHDGVDIQPIDIFRHVANGGDLCGTTAVSVGEYTERFERLSKEYDGVVHICIGASFSSSYQNACIAAADYPNIRVIDSRNLSTGQGHVVMEACRSAKTATDLDALAAELNELTGRVEASFILDRLDYMVKGGRCSMVAALGANLLKLKPCIEVADGKMGVCKKYRGNYVKCLETYVTDRLKDRTDLIYDRIFITYTTCSDEGLKVVHQNIDRWGKFEHVIETHAGCTVSCHCGPGTLGVLFIRKK